MGRWPQRDFTYIENVVHGTLLAAAPGVPVVFNIACGSRISLLAMVGLLNGRSAIVTPDFVAPRPAMYAIRGQRWR